MSETLFTPVIEAHDPRNRPVFICQDNGWFYVYKPATGFTSKKFRTADDAALLEIFEYQKGCGHNGAFYRDGDVVKGGRKAKSDPPAAEPPPPQDPPPAEPQPPVAPPPADPATSAAPPPNGQDEFANED